MNKRTTNDVNARPESRATLISKGADGKIKFTEAEAPPDPGPGVPPPLVSEPPDGSLVEALAQLEHGTGGSFYGSVRVDYKASRPVWVSVQRHDEMRTRRNMSPPPRTTRAADVELLRDVRAVFLNRRADRMPSELLVTDLIALNPHWQSYNLGKELNQHLLSKALRRLDEEIRASVLRFDKEIAILLHEDDPTQNQFRGYRLENLESAFAKYLGEGKA
jgi:Protein of unknown function (DUF3631)